MGLNNAGLRKVSAVFSAVFGYDCETDVERHLNVVFHTHDVSGDVILFSALRNRHLWEIWEITSQYQLG